MSKNDTTKLAAFIIFASAFPAFAQDIFAPPTTILTQIQTFVTGASGVLLGGAVIAAAAIAAAAPRVPFSAGGFFIVLVVLGLFFGAFNIAAVIQGVAA